MSEQHIPRPVENYTNAFLATVALILFVVFWVIAALWGFLAVALSAAAINRCITWFGQRSG